MGGGGEGDGDVLLDGAWGHIFTTGLIIIVRIFNRIIRMGWHIFRIWGLGKFYGN